MENRYDAHHGNLESEAWQSGRPAVGYFDTKSGELWKSGRTFKFKCQKFIYEFSDDSDEFTVLILYKGPGMF
ncbi:hypothetical protein TWF481_002716 [Arthrobotrys musiformis]|uniref:Uncharacterized protein n=1 Tax=Arthrobotrys musiformis TaxID=47236 RepID=A0AAV9VR79_9PEZI